MNDILAKPDGGIASAAARADLWLFLLVAAGLGWLLWSHSGGNQRRQRPDGAVLRALSRSERNRRDDEPMAGYGA